MESHKGLVFGTIGLNVLIGTGDRVCQIVYYCLTNFITETVRSTALAFVIIPSAANFFMFCIYLLAQLEEEATVSVKIKHFFRYMISAEFLYSIGVHKSFKSKYSEYSDNVIITMKVISTFHLMFTSLPQLLIITIHSSSVGTFQPIDIASLVMSIAFIVWSIVYYILCGCYDSDYESELEDCIK